MGYGRIGTTQKSITVHLGYDTSVRPKSPAERHTAGAIPAKANCPFCGEEAVAVPNEGGFWYAIKGCLHCRGIYSTGRVMEGAFTFEGPNDIPRSVA